MFNQLQSIFILHSIFIYVNTWKCEACPCQEVSCISYIRKITCAKGDRRGLMPPSRSICATVHAILSSFNVSPPRIAAKKSPSGFNANLHCIMAPGRSFVQCNPKQLITRSRELSLTGRNSSSPTTKDVSMFSSVISFSNSLHNLTMSSDISIMMSFSTPPPVDPTDSQPQC
uniref:Uncharacterized protein n=1 Tax=Opuntia streptacantha TaxID=393608 RepID=A0A7C9EID0_OPUST